MKFVATALAFLTSLFWQAGGQFSGGGVNSTLNGGPAVVTVAKFDATAQAANVSTTTLYAVPAGQGGTYRIFAYVVITQAATTSSTMPAAALAGFTDNDTGVVSGSNSITATSASNSVGANSVGQGGAGSYTFNAKASTNISISTSGYVSSGVTPMQYAVHFKLEYLGQ